MRSRLAAWRARIATAVLALFGARLEELPAPPESVELTPHGNTALDISRAEVAVRLPLEPDNAILHAMAGSYAIQDGELDAALAAFNRAIQLDGSVSLFYSGRALASLSKNAVEDARKDCETALFLDRDNLEAYQLRGLMRADARDYSGANADFMVIYRARPSAARSISNLAWIRFLQKDAEVAFRLTEQALQRDPDDATAHYVRGSIHARRKDHPAAIREYQAALANWPNIHSPYGQRYFEQMNGYIKRWAE
jgi:tetratricopeptide (TPR) repeat protein